MEISMIYETKKIINESIEIYNELNIKYYKDILNFLNSLYNDDSDSILKIKFKKITLNNEILERYNYIVSKYNLNKKFFNLLNFNINDLNNYTNIIYLAIKISNNLLEKLNLKIYEIIINGNKKLKLRSKYNLF